MFICSITYIIEHINYYHISDLGLNLYVNVKQSIYFESALTFTLTSTTQDFLPGIPGMGGGTIPNVFDFIFDLPLITTRPKKLAPYNPRPKKLAFLPLVFP